MTRLTKTFFKNSQTQVTNIKTSISKLLPFIGLIIVVLFFQIATSGKLLSSKNMMNIFNSLFSIGLGAMGVIFLMSQGELDLSIGAIVGIAAALAALSADISMALIFPVAILTGLLVGWINGIIVAKFKISSFIATLGVSFILRGTTSGLLNGAIGLPLSIRQYDNDILKLSVFFVLLLICYIVFEYTSFGKQSRAIGSLPEAARQSGVNVKKVKILSFMVAGIICGLIAFFNITRTCSASNQTGNGFEFDVLLAVLIGGLPLTGGWDAKFRTVAIGSLAMAVIGSGMSLLGIDGLTQQIIRGILLIFIVVISFDRKNVAVIK